MPNVAFYASYGSLALKRYHEFDEISKPKNVCLTTETKKLVARFVINYHPSERKLLVPLARDRVGCNGLKVEKFYANVFQVLVFLFPKCARTNHESFLSQELS